jgi:hypothetical protein
VIVIERAGLALAALARYREPTRRSLLHRSTEVVCDEHGIGGSGEYCDAHLDRTNVFYPEAFGGKHMPRTVLLDLEPGVIALLP